MTQLFGMYPMNAGYGPESTVTIEEICWGAKDFRETMGGIIHSACTDAGNTPTTTLRAGLLLAYHRTGTYAKMYMPWSATSTVPGGNRIAAIVMNDTTTVTTAGTAVSHHRGDLLVSGRVKSSMLVVPGSSSRSIVGAAYEYVIRRQLAAAGFRLDDRADYPTADMVGGLVVAKTADYTVLASDNGTHFTNTGASGAVNFTLPVTPSQGLEYTFTATVSQNLVLTAGTVDTLVVFHDAAADTVAFQTSSKIIGGTFKVKGDGAKWLVMPMTFADGTNTPTITQTT